MSPVARPDIRMKLRRVIIKLLEWGIHLATLATLVLPFVMWRTFERGFSEWEGQYWFEDELIMVPVMSFTLQRGPFDGS